MKIKLIFLSLLIFLSMGAWAQIKITGKVMDSGNSETLPGVNVLVKGDKGIATGTVTDAEGRFAITVPNEQCTLVFSFIGFLPQEVVVGKQTFLNIQLNLMVKGLDEVVVIGYGTTKRSNLTTAQTTITAKEIEKTVNTTIEQALQGRTAGVYVTQNTGQPGGAISVNIRGVNSINGTNEPLYVIDGVQIPGQSISFGATSSSNPLSGLNPSDIEDFQVLQGPSATALFGSRATNGVILITTKRGKEGITNISYNFQYNIQTPPKHLKVMDLPEYAQMVKEFHAIQGGATPSEFLDPSLLGPGTDWQKELFNISAMKKHQVNMSGGNNKTTYYLSGEYLTQDGVAAGSGFDRYSFRLNLDNKPRDWFKVATSLNFNQTKENLTTSQENLISNGLQLTPQIPVKNLDGTWGGGDLTNGANLYAPVNPIAISNLVTNNNLRRQFVGSLNLDFILNKNLVFRTALNTNVGYSNGIYYVPTYSIGWAKNTIATLSDSNGMNAYWNWNQMLEYNKLFGDHSLNVKLIHESQSSLWKNTSSGRSGFLTSDILDLNAGDPTTASNTGGQGQWAMESFLGMLNYNYRDRYILAGSVRRDGSSNFGPDNRWGTFPAMSVAWRISKEDFFKVDAISELKLRFEVGTTGNQGGGGIYSPMATGATQWGTGFLPAQYSNPALKWEETTTVDAGFNLSLLKNRIQIEFDYFQKKTSNLLMSNPLPYYMGTNGSGAVSSPTVNIGALQNNGWGFTLTTTNINNKNFKWDSNLNISGVKTKITKFYSEAAIVDRTSWWMNSWTQRSVVGMAPWQFLGYIEEGLFKTVDEINNSAVPVDNNGKRLPTNVDNIWVGDVKYKDISGPDGKPDGKIDINDQTFIGNPWPKLYGGFTNTFTYKGIECSVLLTFTYGNDIYNYLAMVNSDPNNINLSRNMLVAAMDYAKPTTLPDGSVGLANPETNVPRLSYGPNGNQSRFTSKWVEDGSFLRVKNISLAYNLPSSLLSRQKVVNNVKLMVSAQNIATITGYKGYDPEVGAYVGRDASSGNQAQGVDYGRYPLAPIYTFNLLINF
jgi:TonB-linked SusC/RagA family outer membrane protein